MGKVNPQLLKAIYDIRDNPGAYSLSDIYQKYKSTLTRDAISSGYRRYKDSYKLVVKREKMGQKNVNPIQLLNRVEVKRNTKNVLVIGDLHEPFCLEGYKDFCYSVYKAYDCTHVVFIGDIIDNHFSSYHETDPDGLAAGRELEKAIEGIEGWTKLFPLADVVIGNHDRMAYRKAHTGGLSTRWVRHYNEVLNAPGWEFREEFIYDGVKYVHGERGSARARIKKDLISTVQGHRHSEAYVDWLVGETFRIFGMQVGCGVDRRSYAMSYGRADNKPAISCGVVLEHGTLPIIVMADLKGGIITNV